MDKKIKVLVVEDSPSACMLLVHILSSHPRIVVQGTASDGAAALEFLQQNKPDVILMDIHMPGMNGYDTTRLVMETAPVPIVVCSGSTSATEVLNVFKAFDAGAVAVVAKPVGTGHPEFENEAAKLVEMVVLMSEVKVVKRWSRMRRPGGSFLVLPMSSAPTTASRLPVVAIGASTGGPPVLQTILSGLPANFPAPVLIVQHIAAGFLVGLMEWLSETTRFPVHIGAHGESPRAGHAYLAPDGYHMGLGRDGRISLSKSEPESGLRPSVSYLFRSVAATCGSGAAAVLLTGMGKDGAEELKALKDIGAVTFAQDAASSIVHGMPGEAIKLDGASYVLPPERICSALIGWGADAVRSGAIPERREA